MNKIKTAIILDPAGTSSSTPEEEALELAQRYRRYVYPQILDCHQGTCVSMIRDGTDLVLFDYGGMMPGNETTMTAQARSVIKWAENHPSALVVIVSTFTFTHLVKYEAEDLGLTDLPNVVVEDPPWGGVYTPLPEWFRVAHGIENRGEPLEDEKQPTIHVLAPPTSTDDAFSCATESAPSPPDDYDADCASSEAEPEAPDPEAKASAPEDTQAWTRRDGWLTPNRVQYRRSATYAKDYWSDSAVTLEEYSCSPGSPMPAFGFTYGDPREVRRWPALCLCVYFLHDRPDLQIKLSERLRSLVDAFLAEHGLDVKAGDKTNP